MSADLSLFLFLHGLTGHSSLFDQIVVFFADTFPYLLIVIFIGLVLTAAYPKREKIEILLVTAFSSLLARFGGVELIRFFYHRPRPFLALSFQPLIPESSWSFPSGHATFFFGMATAIYLYNKRWGYAFFAGATLISLARVAAGVHYPGDILGGALLGAAVAYGVDCLVRRLLKTSDNDILTK